jgi:predicted MFS family arabinose efflux permease
MAAGGACPAADTTADRRNARLYLIGLAASLTGNGAMSLVAGIWVKSLTGSSAEAGLVSACVYAPSLLGPVGGMIADRVRRRRLLFWLNIASAVIMLPLLAVQSPAGIWIIFCVMTWYGVALVVISPAEDALFVEMLPLTLRQRVNGWRLGLQETGRLVAPLLGAGLFALAGGGSVASFDSATFIVAAVVIARLRLRDPEPDHQGAHWRADLMAGLAHIRRTPELGRVLAAAAAVMAMSGVLVAAQYSLVQAAGEPPAFLGVLSACLGGGSIAASLVSGRMLRHLGEGRLAILGMIDFAAGSALRATGVLAGAVVGTIVLGFALPWVFLAVLNLAQRLTPLSVQGRVSAAVTLAMFGPQAPMQALGSFAIRYGTYRQLYSAGAAIALVSAASLLWATRGKRPQSSRRIAR